MKSPICFLLRCGENERPLNEFLILQLGGEHPNGRHNISICKIFGKQHNQEKKMLMENAQNNQVHVQRHILTLPEYDIIEYELILMCLLTENNAFGCQSKYYKKSSQGSRIRVEALISIKRRLVSSNTQKQLDSVPKTLSD